MRPTRNGHLRRSLPSPGLEIPCYTPAKLRRFLTRCSGPKWRLSLESRLLKKTNILTSNPFLSGDPKTGLHPVCTACSTPLPVVTRYESKLTHTQSVPMREEQRLYDNTVPYTFPSSFFSLEERAPAATRTVESVMNCRLPYDVIQKELPSIFCLWQPALHAVARYKHHSKHFFHV